MTGWHANISVNDSCFEGRGELWPCSSTISGNLLLMVFYGGLLGVAAKLISDGAELLLDLGLSAAIVGGVILPLLGAVPDSAIIVASGMGADAQEKISVGMGTLAGSTVMLLTIAWAGSLLVGRCNLKENGEMKEGTGMGQFDLYKQGITPFPEVKVGVVLMLGTTLFYFVIQIADWHFGVKKFTNQPQYVRNAALATMILCIMGLIGYIVYSMYDSKRTDRIARIHREEIMKRHVLHTMLTVANKSAFGKPKSPDAPGSPDQPDGDAEAQVSSKYFKAWHVKKGMKKLKNEGSVEEDEEDALGEGSPLMGKETEKASLQMDNNNKEDNNDEEDSKSKIALKSFGMLGIGVAIVTLFADPMCDVLTALTNKYNKSYIPIPAFYISFVVTPLCSNASELVSSLIFASKRKRENATLTYSQIYGACTMNNTMCLGIFMALVYFKELEWYYSAEVVCIIVVQWVVGIFSFAKTYKLWMGIPIGLIYILSIALIYILEFELGWR